MNPLFHSMARPWIALMILIGALWGCQRETRSAASFQFPERPVENPFYLNSSGITEIDGVAVGNLKRARALTTVDFTMVILDSLPQNTDVSTYAAELFSEWGIGAHNEGKGVLFLFVKESGMLKIEVGYGLEGLYPDGFVGSFQDNLRHYFTGEYFGDFVSGMITSMVKRAIEGDQEALQAPASVLSTEGQLDSGSRFLSGGAGVLESDFFSDPAKKLALIRPIDQETRHKFDKHSDPREVIRRYVESLSLGINSPDLGLLTEGSRYMRVEYPKSVGFQREAARDFSGPFELLIEGDYAAAHFKKASVMPLLLRQDSSGDWLLDVTKSWALIQASNDLLTMRTAFHDHSWMFIWPKSEKWREILATPKPFPLDQDLAATIKELEQQIRDNPEDAAACFRLADIFYFECYWIRSAMEVLEEGFRRKPYSVNQRRRFLTMAFRFPDYSRVAHHLEQMVLRYPDDTYAVKTFIWFLEIHDPRNPILPKLKRWQVEPLLPLVPVIFDARPFYFSRRHFPLPTGTGKVEIDCRHLLSHWDEGSPASVRVMVTDKSRQQAFGIDYTAASPDQPLAAALIVDSTPESATESGTQPVPGQFLALEKPVTISIAWNNDGTASLKVNDDQISARQIGFTPAFLKVYSGSGRVEFTIR